MKDDREKAFKKFLSVVDEHCETYDIERLQDESYGEEAIAEFRAALSEPDWTVHEIKEIIYGMEGFKPKTAPEGYLLQIIKQIEEVATEQPQPQSVAVEALKQAWKALEAFHSEVDECCGECGLNPAYANGFIDAEQAKIEAAIDHITQNYRLREKGEG